MIAGKSSQVMLVAVLVVAYSLCSSMLLILNKVSCPCRSNSFLLKPTLPVSKPYRITTVMIKPYSVQVAVTYIPAPSFILFCQLASSAGYVKVSAMAGLVEAEGLEWEKSKKFALIVFGFIGTLFSNVTSLRVSRQLPDMPRSCTCQTCPEADYCHRTSIDKYWNCNAQYVPVDTIICFRASCPLVIAVIEYFYLDRELPSVRSWASLIGGQSNHSS
jgi:GDP-mannose transporter